jgi:hypothetical protein
MFVDTGLPGSGAREFSDMDERDAPKLRAMRCNCGT